MKKAPKKKTPRKPAKRKPAKRAFRPTEKIFHYNDSYGAKTRSEREFNLEVNNDSGMYHYVTRNKKRLLNRARTDHAGTVNDIVMHGNQPARWYGISPRNIRKKYLRDVISGIDED